MTSARLLGCPLCGWARGLRASRLSTADCIVARCPCGGWEVHGGHSLGTHSVPPVEHRWLDGDQVDHTVGTPMPALWMVRTGTQWMREGIRSPFEVVAPQIGAVVAMGSAVGGAAVVVDHAPDGTARLVYEREDGALLAGDAVRGWDKADEHEALLYRAAEPWNRG